MSRFDFRTGCLCLAATAGLAWPAFGADLPVSGSGTRFFITNEANPNTMLESSDLANPNGAALHMVPPAGLTVTQLGDPNVTTGMWEFQALPGQPGRVVISHLATKAILDAVVDPAAADTVPAVVKLTSPPPPIPTLSQQWRIIAKLAADGVTPAGPFLIKNAQTGQLLDVDTAAPNKAQLLGRDDPVPNGSSRQWRFLSTQVRRTNLKMIPVTVNASKKTVGAPLFPAATPSGNVVDFKGGGPKVTVTVTLKGDGGNEVSANVRMTATDTGDSSKTLDSQTTPDPVVLSLKQKFPGKIIQLLLPVQTQTCTYTDTDDKVDIVVPDADPLLPAPLVTGKIGFLDPLPATVTFAPGTPVDLVALGGSQVKDPNSPPQVFPVLKTFVTKLAGLNNPVVRCCICVGRPPGAPANADGRTCVLVILERMPFLTDVP